MTPTVYECRVRFAVAANLPQRPEVPKISRGWLRQAAMPCRLPHAPSFYVFKDAEVVDFAAPYGVFSVARRYDPELDVFPIADANRPVQAQA